jgi:hypothetical protein
MLSDPDGLNNFQSFVYNFQKLNPIFLHFSEPPEINSIFEENSSKHQLIMIGEPQFLIFYKHLDPSSRARLVFFVVSVRRLQE